VILSKKEKYSGSSPKISIIPKKKYKVTTEYVGIEGKPYCAYFGVIIFDKNKKEIARLIKWMNDFSENQINLEIIFNAPESSEKILVIYRINNETPARLKCKFVLKNPEEIKPTAVDSSFLESFDSLNYFEGLETVQKNEKQNYSVSSPKISIIPKKKYKVTTEYAGIQGKPYCAYFGVIIFDKNKKEIARLIKWMNDFSGIRQEENLVFKALDNAAYLDIVYRINSEVPLKTSIEFMLLPISKISVKWETSLKENYSIPEQFLHPETDELNEESELLLEQNIVWIFASSRSGTTWLKDLLSYKTNKLNEPLLGYHLGRHQSEIKDNIVRGIDLYGDDADYFFSFRYKKTWLHYLRKLILNRIHVQFQDFKKNIIIKEPNGSMGADILAECTPTSKIILLLRDGRDVIDSKLDTFQKNSWAAKQYGITPMPKSRRLEEIKHMAMAWVKQMEILMKTYDNHQKENRLKIKYEDLRANTVNELKKIYEFIDLSITKSELEKMVEKLSFENIPKEKKGPGKFTRSARPGKWKSVFNKSEKKVMTEIMGQKLKELGYN